MYAPPQSGVPMSQTFGHLDLYARADAILNRQTICSKQILPAWVRMIPEPNVLIFEPLPSSDPQTARVPEHSDESPPRARHRDFDFVLDPLSLRRQPATIAGSSRLGYLLSRGTKFQFQKSIQLQRVIRIGIQWGRGAQTQNDFSSGHPDGVHARACTGELSSFWSQIRTKSQDVPSVTQQRQLRVTRPTDL